MNQIAVYHTDTTMSFYGTYRDRNEKGWDETFDKCGS